MGVGRAGAAPRPGRRPKRRQGPPERLPDLHGRQGRASPVLTRPASLAGTAVVPPPVKRGCGGPRAEFSFPAACFRTLSLARPATLVRRSLFPVRVPRSCPRVGARPRAAQCPRHVHAHDAGPGDEQAGEVRDAAADARTEGSRATRETMPKPKRSPQVSVDCRGSGSHGPPPSAARRAAAGPGGPPRRRCAGRPSPGTSRPARTRTPRPAPCARAGWRRVPSSARRPAVRRASIPVMPFTVGSRGRWHWG